MKETRAQPSLGISATQLVTRASATWRHRDLIFGRARLRSESHKGGSGSGAGRIGAAAALASPLQLLEPEVARGLASEGRRRRKAGGEGECEVLSDSWSRLQQMVLYCVVEKFWYEQSEYEAGGGLTGTESWSEGEGSAQHPLCARCGRRWVGASTVWSIGPA